MLSVLKSNWSFLIKHESDSSMMVHSLRTTPSFFIYILLGEPRSNALFYFGSAMANKYHFSWPLGTSVSASFKE